MEPLPDAVVSASYSGIEGMLVAGVKTYGQIASALADAPSDRARPYVIFIQNGRYAEKLTIVRPFIRLLGESREHTLLTFDAAAGSLRPDGTPYGTFESATVSVHAPHFAAESLTIENGFDYPAHYAKVAGAPAQLSGAQAVALKTDAGSDQALFKDVQLLGFQDTLYANVGRQIFKRCRIAGHIDFIFGAGQAVFDECDIVSVSHPANIGYVTAASTPLSRPYGFLFTGCRLIKGSPEVLDGSVMLGRPWHPTTQWADGTHAADPHAAGCVVFRDCIMEGHISAEGWAPMAGRDKNDEKIWFYPQDARFYEYRSTGPGAISSLSRRVLSEDEAQRYVPRQILDGWEPEQ